MKLYLVAHLAVDTQAWVRDYSECDASETAVLAAVAAYFNQELIAGTPAVAAGLLSIVDVARVKSARSPAQRVGATGASKVPMLLQIQVEVDRPRWARDNELDAQAVPADVCDYFEMNVFGEFSGSAPAVSGAIELLDIEHSARARRPVTV